MNRITGGKKKRRKRKRPGIGRAFRHFSRSRCDPPLGRSSREQTSSGPDGGLPLSTTHKKRQSKKKSIASTATQKTEASKLTYGDRILTLIRNVQVLQHPVRQVGSCSASPTGLLLIEPMGKDDK